VQLPHTLLIKLGRRVKLITYVYRKLAALVFMYLRSINSLLSETDSTSLTRLALIKTIAHIRRFSTQQLRQA